MIGDQNWLRCAVSWFRRSSVENTFHLVGCDQLPYITSFDISECNNIDASTVVDIMAVMQNLSIFIYRHSKAISEHNLVRIASTCPTLTYIDGTGGREVSYASALAVLCSLKKLTKIAVKPRKGESAHWAKLIMQFDKVVFAYCIKCTLPYEGLSRNAFAELKKLAEF